MAAENSLVRSATVDKTSANALQPRHNIAPRPHLVLILLAALTLLPVRAFAALSLLPAIKMVRGVVPAPVGHFVAYAVAAAITMTVYGARRGSMQIIGGFWVYAGVLEYLQHFSPGRHPGIVAFIGSALGALCGGLVVLLCHRRSEWTRRRLSVRCMINGCRLLGAGLSRAILARSDCPSRLHVRASHIHAPMCVSVGCRGIGRVGRLSLTGWRLCASGERQ